MYNPVLFFDDIPTVLPGHGQSNRPVPPKLGQPPHSNFHNVLCLWLVQFGRMPSLHHPANLELLEQHCGPHQLNVLCMVDAQLLAQPLECRQP